MRGKQQSGCPAGEKKKVIETTKIQRNICDYGIIDNSIFLEEKKSV